MRNISYTVHYGFIKNEKGEKVDEVLATVMLAPKTFTREDVVEISTHGGSTASRAVLDTIKEQARIWQSPVSLRNVHF